MSSDLFLLDTSAWVELLSQGPRNTALWERVRLLLLLSDQVACTGMVKLELLVGARSEVEWEQVEDRLDGTQWLEVVDEDWTQAARLGYELRRKGKTVPSTDLLIAAVAQRHGATVLHKDKHYDVLAEELGLPVESYVTSPA